MRFLRSFVVYGISSCFIIFLSLFTWLLLIQTTVLSPVVVKGWLNSSGLYNQLVDLISPQFIGPGQSLITPRIVRQVLNKTFPPAYVRIQAETAIDDIYQWMNGSKPQLTFTVPIDQKKQVAITQMASALEPSVAQLPACNQLQFLHNLEATNLSCRPSGQSASAFAHSLADQTINDSQLFDKPLTYTLSTNSVVPTVFVTQLPRRVADIRLLLLVLPFLGLLCLLAISLIARSRLLAFLRLSRSIFISSLPTLVLATIILYFINHPAPASALPASVPTIFMPLLRQVLSSIGWRLFYLFGTVALISLISWTLLHYLYKKQQQKRLSASDATQTPQSSLNATPVL